MKILKVLMAIVLFAGVCLADNYTLPKDNNEQIPGNANLVGVTSKYSTTLSTVMVTNVSAAVYGVTLYTDVAVDTTMYAVIYDTNSAKSNVGFVASTYDAFRVSSNLAFSSVTVADLANNRTEFNFNPPIICNDGVYVAFPGYQTSTTGIQWTIHYRNRNKGN